MPMWDIGWANERGQAMVGYSGSLRAYDSEKSWDLSMVSPMDL